MSWFLSLGRVPLMVTSRALCVHLIHPRPHFFSHSSSPILAIVTGLVLLYLAGQIFFFSCGFSSDHSCFSSGCFLFASSSPTGLINSLSRSGPRPETGIDNYLQNLPLHSPLRQSPVSGGTSRKQDQLTLCVTLRPIPRVPQRALPQSLTRLNI